MLDVIEGLPEDGWTGIGPVGDATPVRHRPAGREEQGYMAVRRRRDRGQTLLLPVCTVIPVALDELVRRHRGKQRQENAFKEPLIDLGPHRPPCRKFRAGQVFHICGQLARMLLRAMQYRLSPVRARRRGRRPLIRCPVRAVTRPVRSGRRRRPDFARNTFRLDHAAVQLEWQARRSPLTPRSKPARPRRSPLARRTEKRAVRPAKPPDPALRRNCTHRFRHR